MFLAIMLACSPMLPQGCVIVEDNWGPYNTIQECKARNMEMMEVWTDIMPFTYQLTPRCKDIGQEKV